MCSRAGQGRAGLPRSRTAAPQSADGLTVRWKMQMSVSAAAHLGFVFSSSPLESNANLADSGYTVTITLDVSVMRVYSARSFLEITVNVWII